MKYKYKLSILIPSRSEMFLSKTIENILENTGEETEIIAGLDGEWSVPPVQSHPRVTLVYMPESLGQRGMTNLLCKISKARYVAKMDAHVALDKNWDQKMFKAFEKSGDNVVMVSIMRNLHAFDWVCPNGHRRYQGPSGPCKECGKETQREIMWIGKQSPQSRSYCFDSEPHFQYFNEYCKRSQYNKDREETGLTETMSLQGSCFMVTREKYWELDICNEDFGSWGSHGIQIACSFWLSGGRVLVNHDTWYAHMFRTQGQDFGFPYPQSGNQVQRAKTYARHLMHTNGWPKQIYPTSWLVERFWPVKGWTDADLANLKKMESTPRETLPVNVKKGQKGIIYYTTNQLTLKIARAVQKQLKKISKEKGIPIVSASLKPMDNMGKNIHLPLAPGTMTYFKQILAALEASEAEYIFFAEHDVLYSDSHFNFLPPTKDKFYYNHNWWRVRKDGLAAH